MAEEDEVRITLRLPEALRHQLKQASDFYGRSMNAEIVSRLNGSLNTNGEEIASLSEVVRLQEDKISAQNALIETSEQLKSSLLRLIKIQSAQLYQQSKFIQHQSKRLISLNALSEGELETLNIFLKSNEELMSHLEAEIDAERIRGERIVSSQT